MTQSNHEFVKRSLLIALTLGTLFVDLRRETWADGPPQNSSPTKPLSLFRTSSFHVTSRNPRCGAKVVGKQCERLRESLQQQWIPDQASNDVPWTPLCEIVVHANEHAYLQEVGIKAAMTRGVCRIDKQHGRITRRRIDLLADVQSDELTALAHEMTHVVLADSYITRVLPRWADEGMALLADRSQKRSLHLRSVHRAIERQTCPNLSVTLARRDYPQGEQLGVFYGQSLSLVEFLLELDEPTRLVEFVDVGMVDGYDQAAHRVYGFKNVAELNTRWRFHVASSAIR